MALPPESLVSFRSSGVRADGEIWSSKTRASLLLGLVVAGCSLFGKSKDPDSVDDGGVFDARGMRHDCRRGPGSCDEVKEVSDAFEDQCDDAGFRIVQCGCKEFCTGNVVNEKLHYDEKNKGKECADAKDDCELPESRAAFQDACSDVGGQLVQCACEWRCNRKLKEAVPEAPPPEEETDAGAPEGEGAGDGAGEAEKKE